MKKKILICFSLSMLMILSNFFNIFSIFESTSNANEVNYNLSFELTRDEFRGIEPRPTAIYFNHWIAQPPNDIANPTTWDLNDFSMNFNLHVEGQTQPITKTMSYESDSYTWNGKTLFENIQIPYNNIEVQYYSSPTGDFIEPYLLNYDLYLKKGDGKMILSVPKLLYDENYQPTEAVPKVLEVKNIKVKEVGSIIYLNGTSGNDALDGSTEANAVKSFAKAKEIATANKNIKTIIVTGTTSIEGDISLANTNATVIRGENFNGFLFTVNNSKTASLSNITIDGNIENNKNITNSIIKVNQQATLNISSGTVLKNNKIKDLPNDRSFGGAIFASKATVNMSGGLIDNNASTDGGGICLHNSTLNITSGIIQNNLAKQLVDTSVNQVYSSGGGILADNGSTINLSGDTKILNNRADEIGGGISLGSQDWGATNTLNMSSGTIDSNTAGASGGGIFVQAKYFTGGASKAYITSGNITNNVMDGTGRSNKMFGGGGIYVNGANNSYRVNGANGELHLKNAIITDNTAKYEGAGFASCPISKAHIYVTNGAAIYNNHSETQPKQREVYLLASAYLGLHSGNPEYSFAKRMLGGVLYDWKDENDNPLADDKHSGTLTGSNNHISLYTDAMGNELTASLGKVFINGNKSATRGGGIGSNGSIFIGEDEVTSVKVKKEWVHNENTDTPQSVEVQLIANEQYVIETKTLNEANNWSTVFSNLPTKIGEEPISYTVKEASVKDYTSNITGNKDDGFVITNTFSPKKISIPVTKVWNDNNDASLLRPNEVSIKLFANGNDTGKIVNLNEQNNWSSSFDNLKEKDDNGKPIEYTVKEVSVNYYSSDITGNKTDGFVVTNTFVPNKINIPVTKIWKDNNNKAKNRPDSIIIHLLADGQDTGKTLILNDKNNWKGEFLDLSEKVDGKTVDYTIKEEKVAKYKSKIDGNMKDGFKVTNKYVPPSPKVPNTNDTNSPILYFSILLLSVLTFAYSRKIKNIN